LIYFKVKKNSNQSEKEIFALKFLNCNCIIDEKYFIFFQFRLKYFKNQKYQANMVRVISQETFDSVVKENMDDFGLEKEEAIKEAISQFESQV